ncbi:transposase family protein [Streptomyces sp. NBC_00158]|uniref:transposase family protein n=1 Tax=Streptomyces sp. NBC_00158 TaxID=2903627 RepID=UPI003251CB63
MQTDTPFWDSLVFDGIDDVDVEAVTAAFGTVEVAARSRAATSACPDCGRFSDRVHDCYQRGLKDLPLAEQGFVIQLTVRRFICGAATARAGRSPSRSRSWLHRTHGSPLGSTTPWTEWGSRWPGGLAPGWPPSWASEPSGTITTCHPCCRTCSMTV